MNTISMKRYVVPAVLILLALVPGCARKMVKVQGKVLLDGQPVEGATVSFQPDEESGPPASGLTGSDGVFRLTTHTSGDGARPGNYKVVITKTSTGSGDSPDGPMDKEAMKAAWEKYAAGMKSRKAPPKTGAALPAAYGNVKSTPLKCRVPPDGPVEFDLRSKGGS
jgi:hypothetical protein